MKKINLVISILAFMMLTGCDKPPSSSSAAVPPQRTIDSVQVARGRELFLKNCARCHGEMAQGDPTWRRRSADGTFPPPPLNGTGHAWHHPHDWLHEVIVTGTEPQGHMPAWGGKLTDQSIDDIIAWFQSLWPDEVYAAWLEMERRSHGANQ